MCMYIQILEHQTFRKFDMAAQRVQWMISHYFFWRPTWNEEVFLKDIGVASTALSATGCSVLPPERFCIYTRQALFPRRLLGRSGISVSVLGFGSHLNKELLGNPQIERQDDQTWFRERHKYIRCIWPRQLQAVQTNGGKYPWIPQGCRHFTCCSEKKQKKCRKRLMGALKVFHSDYIDLYPKLSGWWWQNEHSWKKTGSPGKIRAVGIVTHDTESMMNHINRYQSILDFGHDNIQFSP